jgi:transglutaminase-like putative cysteine protease
MSPPSSPGRESRQADLVSGWRESTLMGQQPQVRTDLFRVRHITRYRYKTPVAFGQHKAMFRPHETQDLRLLSMNVSSSPASMIHWIHDAFSNSVTLFEFTEKSDLLEIVCEFDLIRTSFKDVEFPVADYAQRYPFNYAADQLPDLAPCRIPYYPDPDRVLTGFAQRFVEESGGDTWALLTGMTRAIKAEFSYQRREEPGVQAPIDTLATGAGSCRDFAALMCEAARHLGLAARFVTGYLYDPALDGGSFEVGDVTGAGATHAWVQIFLPGAGWIEFDPTNGDVASGRLIRTGVGRMPSHVAPVSGSYAGAPEDALGLEVEVEVTTLAPPVTQ